jgi:hypothetical protein
MDSGVARPATTWGNAHRTIKHGSFRITVTSTSGISFFAIMAAGPPAPLHPTITSFSPFFIFAPLLGLIGKIKGCLIKKDEFVKSQFLSFYEFIKKELTMNTIPPQIASIYS